MSRRALWLVALLLVLATALTLSWQVLKPPPGADSPPAAGPSVLETTPSLPAPASRAALDAPWATWALPEDLAAIEPLEPGTAATIRGRLVHEGTFAPVAGVHVVLTHRWLQSVVPGPADREFFARVNDSRLTPVRAISDEQGRFALSPVHPGITLFLAIGIGSHLADLRKVERLPGPGETVELAPIVLALRGGIRGRLVEGDHPLVGVRIRAIDDPILANPLASLGEREVAVRAAAEFDATAAPRPDVARGAHLLPFHETLTDADGAFCIEGVRPGRPSLIAQVPGMRAIARDVLVQPTATTDIGTIQVEPRAATLRILDPSDQPMAGIEVVESTPAFELLADGKLSRITRPTAAVRTDSRGCCAVQEPLAEPEGFTGISLPAAISIRRRSGLPWETVSKKSPAAGETNSAVYCADDLCHGTFVLPALTAGQHAVLRLHRAMGALGRESGPLPDRDQPAEQTPERFTVGGLPSATYLLQAFVPGYAPFVEELDLADGKVRSQLQAGYALPAWPTFPLTLRVIDERDQPVPRAEVFATFADEPDPVEPRRPQRGKRWSQLDGTRPLFLGRTGADGSLELPGFWPCQVRFGVRRPGGWIAGWVEQQVAAPRVIEIPILDFAELTGQLVERWVAPHSPWLVELVPEPRPGLVDAGSPALDPIPDPRRTVTNPDGTFAFHEVVAGAYRLGVSHPDAERLHIVLAPGARVFETIAARTALDGAARLAGCVTIDGAAADGIVVRIAAASERNSERPWRDAMFTDREGLFSFRPRGRNFELVFERRDRGIDQQLARLPWTSRSSSRLDVILHTGAARLELSTQDSPLRQRTIVLEQVGGTGARFEAVTDSHGMVVVERMPAGRYAIRGTGPTTPPSAETIDVRPREDTVARLRLP